MTADFVASGSLVERSAEIADMRDPVLRNLHITECYADLSAAMRVRTGGWADWCTFATWASRQAGATIRGEDLLAALRRRLRAPWILAPVASLKRTLLRKGLFRPETRLGRVVAEIHTPFDAFERASAEVARGNEKVFAEIGVEFARFLSEVPDDARHDSSEFVAFVDTLRPGPPPDGQDSLRKAFACYVRQRHEPDLAARTAWILFGNLLVGLHEQTRLQPQIEAAVDAPLTTTADLGERVLHALVPGSRRWPRLVHRPAATLTGWVARAIRHEAIAITREVVTDRMMTLALPGRVLSLAQSVDMPVPASLRDATIAEVAAFLREYDPCAPGGTACGASNWCDLRQRMHYIVHLFRGFADDRSLFARPFTPEQVAAFRAGVVPTGDL
jgi:hypothetical protein